MVAIIVEFPASPQVIVVVEDMVYSDPTCTEEEKASLVEDLASIEEAKEFLDEALEEAQDNLFEATGSTLSPSTTGHVVSTTTMASRFRMRGFQKQLFSQ